MKNLTQTFERDKDAFISNIISIVHDIYSPSTHIQDQRKDKDLLLKSRLIDFINQTLEMQRKTP